MNIRDHVGVGVCAVCALRSGYYADRQIKWRITGLPSTVRSWLVCWLCGPTRRAAGLALLSELEGAFTGSPERMLVLHALLAELEDEAP